MTEQNFLSDSSLAAEDEVANEKGFVLMMVIYRALQGTWGEKNYLEIPKILRILWIPTKFLWIPT